MKIPPALLLATLLAACNSSAAVPGEPPLAGARMGGPFTLVGEDGKTVRDTDFNGRYRLVYFGYSYCPDICPGTLARIGTALRDLEKSDPDKAAKVQPLFITVDPERDTPAVLKQYTDLFHPRLLGLTGSPEAVERVEKEYAVFASKERDAGAGDYVMNHSNTVVLYGPEGQPIVALTNTPETTPAQMAEQMAQWIS